MKSGLRLSFLFFIVLGCMDVSLLGQGVFGKPGISSTTAPDTLTNEINMADTVSSIPLTKAEWRQLDKQQKKAEAKHRRNGKLNLAFLKIAGYTLAGILMLLFGLEVCYDC